MEYRPMFFRQMTDAFLVRTEPASSMVNPAHIHITSAPQIRNEKVLKTNWDSCSTAAFTLTETNKRITPVRNLPGNAKRWSDGLIRLPFIAFPLLFFLERRTDFITERYPEQ